MQTTIDVEPAFKPESASTEPMASPHQLVQVLIDAAVLSVETARNEMVKQRIPEKGEAISKAIDILTGLMESLDMENGGEISHNLMALYEYMQNKLIKANLYNRIDFLNEVLEILSQIREGWNAIPEELRQANAG